MCEPVELPIALRDEEVYHFLGYPSDRRPPERIAHRVAELREEALARILARGVHRPLAVEEAGDVGLAPMEAAGLVIGLVTVGQALERRSTELLEQEDAVGGLVLDAMGSAAVEEAADRLGAIIAGGDAHEEPAPALSCRISPGYGEWSLAAQPRLFERLPHQRLGVELLPSLLMVPRKSISFAMWLGADTRPLTGLSGCARCPLERCRYRREPDPEGGWA